MIEIPKRFQDASLKDWPEGSVIRTILDAYLENFASLSGEGQAPVFLGNSGVGKSRAAAAILNAVILGSNGRYTGAWFSTSEVLNRLLDYRDMYNSSMYNIILTALKQTDIIVLDDFTTLRDAPRLKEYFWMILEARYVAQLPTVLTANFYINSDEDVEEFWHNMSNHFGVPFVRRIKEIGKGLTLIL